MNETARVARVIKHSFLLGIAELGGLYTWHSWLLGWLFRVVAQVVFFSLMGLLLGGPGDTRDLLVGSAAAAAVLEALTIMLWVVGDRHQGTLAMVVASPANYYLVALARGAYLVLTATATATFALIAGSAIMKVGLAWPTAFGAVPVIASGVVSTYVFGSFVAAFAMRFPHAQWLCLNLSYMLLVTLGGFMIPATYWPFYLRTAMAAAPFSHALRALREVLTGNPSWTTVLAQCGWETVVTALWGLAAATAFHLILRRERESGELAMTA